MLGTGGGIRKAAPQLRGGSPIIVMNADCLTEIDLHSVVAAHRESGMLATLVLTAHRAGYSVVEIDDERRVTRFVLGSGGLEEGQLMFTGLHVLLACTVGMLPEKICLLHETRGGLGGIEL